MTAHALLPRLLPGIFFLCLVLLSILLNFNGLYGQDAHEYLRQSQIIFDRLHGLPAPMPGLGETEFAGVFPLAGALLRFLVGDAILALQLVSWLSAAFGVFVFERLLSLLAPGARADSRWVYVGLGLMLAPMFLRSGLTSMSDGLGLTLALSAFFFGFRALESWRIRDIMAFAAFSAFSISTRYALAALLLPLAVSGMYFLVLRKKWLGLAAGILVGGLALLPHFWLKTGGAENPLGYSGLKVWSVANFFQRTFEWEDGGITHYKLPNLLYLLYPFAHPAFFLALPGLFFLFKKTDRLLLPKRILLICLAGYLFFLGGFKLQNLRFLLPAYTLLLLLLFPAWDRLYCYGFIFFRRLTSGILIGALVIQLVFGVKYLLPVLKRHHLEKTVANKLKEVLPSNAMLFAFDLDPALHSYLPALRIQNLWVRRYAEFPVGSYVLFNEGLRPQWQGRNPILNWDELKVRHSLELKAELPQGWGLWEIQ